MQLFFQRHYFALSAGMFSHINQMGPCLCSVTSTLEKMGWIISVVWTGSITNVWCYIYDLRINERADWLKLIDDLSFIVPVPIHSWNMKMFVTLLILSCVVKNDWRLLEFHVCIQHCGCLIQRWIKLLLVPLVTFYNCLIQCYFNVLFLFSVLPPYILSGLQCILMKIVDLFSYHRLQINDLHKIHLSSYLEKVLAASIMT